MSEHGFLHGDEDRHEALIADVARVMDSENALMRLAQTESDTSHELLISDISEVLDFDDMLNQVVSRATSVTAAGVSKVRRGTVLSFDIARGYGYIRPDDGGKDVFFDVIDTEGPLSVGQRVEFEDKPQEEKVVFGTSRLWISGPGVA